MADYGLLERNLLINRDLVDRECMGYRKVWVMTGMGYDRVDCNMHTLRGELHNPPEQSSTHGQ